MDILLKPDKKQIRLVRKMRGEFLGEATEVEDLLSDVIATHFFPNFLFDTHELEQYERLRTTVLGHRSFSFRTKSDALRYILEQAHPDLYEEHKEALVKLEKVIAHRNILAHGHFIQELPMPNFIKKQIDKSEKVLLETFRNGKVFPHFLTLDEANLKLKEARQVSKSLAILGGELRRQAHDNIPQRKQSDESP